MAPKDDPELIVYVAVQQPEYGNYGDGSNRDIIYLYISHEK